MNAHMDSYATEHASLRARLLCTTAGFPWDEMDDARQDLLLITCADRRSSTGAAATRMVLFEA